MTASYNFPKKSSNKVKIFGTIFWGISRHFARSFWRPECFQLGLKKATKIPKCNVSIAVKSSWQNNVGQGRDTSKIFVICLLCKQIPTSVLSMRNVTSFLDILICSNICISCVLKEWLTVFESSFLFSSFYFFQRTLVVWNEALMT